MYSVNLDNLKESRFHTIEANMLVDFRKLTKLGAIVAGGALRTLIDKDDVVCDIDLFFKDRNDINSVKNELESNGYAKVFECPLGHLTTYYYFGEKVVGKRYNGSDEYEVLSKVQLITRDMFASLEHVVSEFDLMPCCASMDNERLMFADKWVMSVKKKMLYLNNITYPVATLNRVVKYVNKGYYAGEHFYKEVIESIQNSNFDGDRLALYID